jgi:hypothetical protein
MFDLDDAVHDEALTAGEGVVLVVRRTAAGGREALWVGRCTDLTDRLAAGLRARGASEAHVYFVAGLDALQAERDLATPVRRRVAMRTVPRLAA